MADFRTDFSTLLHRVRRPGTFAFAGTRPVGIPRIEVQGVGLLSFPLPTFQAEQLKAVAEPAPYGRGAETVLDPTVRRAWQFPAEQVHLDARWQVLLAEIVAAARVGLAVEAEVEAQLYKLMVYDTGCFFVRHRDSAKTEGMFGTLVVVLPSPFDGGELVVSHRGDTVRLPLQAGFSDIAWAAFYADCEHCLEPITSGHRLALIYNLVRKDRGALPRVAVNDAEHAALVDLLKAEGALLDDLECDHPVKRVYPLAHRYLAPELSFAALKNEDRAAAALLRQAAQAAGWTVHLAILNIEQSGGADVLYHRRGDDEFTVGEIDQESRYLTQWVAPKGAPHFAAPLVLEEGELCPADALADAEPDELEYSEASGNEGASFARAWRRAALVCWPDRHFIDVLETGGAAAMATALTALAQRFAAGEAEVAPLAHALAGRLMRHLPGPRRYPDPGPLAGVAATLAALVRFGNIERIDHLAREVAAGPKWHISGNPHLLAAFALLPPARIGELVALMAEQHAVLRPAIVADLLDHLRLTPAAPHLICAIEILVQRLPAAAPLLASTLTALVRALETLDTHRALAAVDHLLSTATPRAFDTALRPAVLDLGGGGPAFARLHQAVTDHLDARIALPLDPPPDWGREPTLKCKCRDCIAFNHFMADPTQKTWALKAIQDRRRHVEREVQAHPCDVDLSTEHRGSPHSLIATKNQASYLKRCAQRTADRADRAQLAAIRPGR